MNTELNQLIFILFRDIVACKNIDIDIPIYEKYKDELGNLDELIRDIMLITSRVKVKRIDVKVDEDNYIHTEFDIDLYELSPFHTPRNLILFTALYASVCRVIMDSTLDKLNSTFGVDDTYMLRSVILIDSLGTAKMTLLGYNNSYKQMLDYISDVLKDQKLAELIMYR